MAAEEQLEQETQVAPDEDAPENGAPPPLDPEREARRVAALRQIRRLGDPALRARALAVERFDGTLRAEAERMGKIMADAIGVGLAATQLGVMHRVLVYRVEPGSPIVALVNPEVEWSGKEHELLDEGCLSLPGIHVEVERPIHVRVRSHDERGDELLIEASGLEARVLQHEIDHLDGILMLDRASREQRKLAMRALREAATGRPPDASAADGDASPADGDAAAPDAPAA